MKNWDKTKALERLYAGLSQSELEPRPSPGITPYTNLPVTINLLYQDVPHILDVLSEAIAKERAQ